MKFTQLTRDYLKVARRGRWIEKNKLVADPAQFDAAFLVGISIVTGAVLVFAVLVVS